MDYTPVGEPNRGVARKLTLYYVVASTAIFLVAGLLGMVLRQSQADIVRLDDNYWYAVMTAHGLGAFVGWAAFAVMGFGFWVLSEVGFPISTPPAARDDRPGGPWSSASPAWWSPRWSSASAARGSSSTRCRSTRRGSGATSSPAFFSFSVLLAGVSIIAWCVSIIVIVTGPGLGSDKGGVEPPRRRHGPRHPLAQASSSAPSPCPTRSSR